MKYAEGVLMDNRYVLKRFIGSGSFGEVWLATDKETDLDVAIKIYISMDSQGLSDFKNEFQLSFNLNHTNLLHANYLGVNVADSSPYLVMPFCAKGSVSKYAGKMDETQMWKFIHDVSAGLAYLHSQNPPIIHQDIKPDNILMLNNGDYVITDFGISKQLKKTLTRSMSHVNSAGAIAYMGPERFSKQYQAVKASDIWSLGVTIYELIVGEMPFCGMGGSMQKQGADIPELPDEYSEHMKLLFTSCLAKETWDRPSAQQIAEYSYKCIRGEEPQVTWNMPVKENAVNEVQPVSAPAEKVNGTDRSAVSVSLSNSGGYGQTVSAQNSGGVRSYSPRPSYKVRKKENNWVLYLMASVLGLIGGILLKLLM